MVRHVLLTRWKIEHSAKSCVLQVLLLRKKQQRAILVIREVKNEM